MSKIKFSILLQTSILLITKVHLNIKDISKFIQHSTKYHLHPLYLQNQIFYPNSKLKYHSINNKNTFKYKRPSKFIQIKFSILLKNFITYTIPT